MAAPGCSPTPPPSAWSAWPGPRGARFGQRLRAHRLAAGLAQEQLAARAGLSTGIVWAYEQDERRLREDSLAKLVAVLGAVLTTGPAGQGEGTLSLLSTQDYEGVAWWAHVGGFVAGIALLPVFTRSRQQYRRWYADKYRPW